MNSKEKIGGIGEPLEIIDRGASLRVEVDFILPLDLAHQACCEYWAQGPNSRGMPRACCFNSRLATLGRLEHHETGRSAHSTFAVLAA